MYAFRCRKYQRTLAAGDRSRRPPRIPCLIWINVSQFSVMDRSSIRAKCLGRICWFSSFWVSSQSCSDNLSGRVPNRRPEDTQQEDTEPRKEIALGISTRPIPHATKFLHSDLHCLLHPSQHLRSSPHLKQVRNELPRPSRRKSSGSHLNTQI